MDSESFVIPLDKDELANTYFGQYSQRKIVHMQMINKEIDAISHKHLTDKGPVDLVSEKLDLLLSVIVHGNKLELVLLLRFFGRILKITQAFLAHLEQLAETSQELDVEQSQKIKLLSTNKILAYNMSSLLCLIEDQIADNSNNNINNIGKRKKNVQKTDIEEEWDTQREKTLETLHRWLQLPLKNLWTPSVVEDSFVATISQICYKILEKTKDTKSKNNRNLVFQILGTLIKRYNHGIACVLRIIQLAKFHEELAAPIGAGVALMVDECGCTGLIKELAKEIDESEPGEADARNLCAFLESIAATKAEVLLPILDNIMDYLANSSYVMRNCAIGVMGVIVANVLTGEDLPSEKRITRDDCLDNLELHILDVNAYVRSKVLQTWQKLCCEGAIPLSRQNRLLKASVLRLKDKSANVRKQALQLLRVVLQSNPFASKINQEKFAQNLEQAKADLKKLQTEIYHTVGAEEEKEALWNTQLPLIEEAINKLTEQDRNNDDNKEDHEESEEIDIKDTFDQIQNYILQDKCLKAVKYLQKLFIQSGFAKEMKNLSEETKKEALLLFMYKIFMNSSTKKDKDEKGSKCKKEKSSKTLATDQEEIKQLDQIKVKKKLVDYLQNCYTFSIELEKTIPIVEKLLYSLNPGDALEACSFLGAAYQFQIAGALPGVRKALFQIFSPNQSVRDNLTTVYKEIYLNHSGNQASSHAKALQSVKCIIQLLDGMLPGQSAALSKLIVSWRLNNELDAEALKVMWEMFSLKLPNTTPLESRSALVLLKMAADAEPNIITDNLDVLIKVGLGPRTQTDLLLARDTCRALLSIKQDSTKDIDKSPIKFANDHEMFKQICDLLKDTFLDENENGYISFATDAINVIYHLADQPAKLVEEVMAYVAKVGKFLRTDGTTENMAEIHPRVIARFLYLIGHVGIREMVYLDHSIYKELKRRANVCEKKKEARSRKSKTGRRKSTNMSIISNMSSTSITAGSVHRSKRSNKNTDEDTEYGMEGATADDADAEYIDMVLENELLADGSYLSKFLPFVSEVCQHPEIYQDESIQAYGVLALSKLMTISSKFCENKLQLLVTILERSAYPQIRANILVGLSDLMTRFPNQIEPWTSHIYGRLKDDNIKVRITCVRMLSSLILGEMIRVKGQVAQLALCIVEDNETIRSEAKQLFSDLSNKGNALYNVIPDILSCLSDSDVNLSEKHFQEIIKYILGLLQKDGQTKIDSIIVKLCSRFKLATTERQWRDLSYCLSLMKFSAKGIRILIKDLPLLKEKIHNNDVQKALNCIIEQAKRQPDAKTACMELEEKIKELLDATEATTDATKPMSDSEAMPPPLRPVPKTTKAKKLLRRRKIIDEDDDDDEDDEDYENRPSTRNSSISKTARRTKTPVKDNSSTESESEDANKTPRRSTRTAQKTPKSSSEESISQRTPKSDKKSKSKTPLLDDTPVRSSRRRIESNKDRTPPGKKSRSSRS